ncbi:trypsin-like peptidase domain-containing protein [Thermodesulfobacteriota bacterium]
MKKFTSAIYIAVLLLFQAGFFCQADVSIREIETKVVRVFATKKANYYHKPWKTPNFASVRGSGFFFKDEQAFPGEKGLILTNAHVVSMAQSLWVSNGREKRRYRVKPIGTCNMADFAVVQMEAREFGAYEERNGEVVPLELGDSDKVRMGDKVQGWGYPLGGERISKSEEGEISRIEVNRYAYSRELWLMVQASLQQNRGNSGGPVLKEGKVVGIAFQGIRSGDRLNYFIPINLVRGLLPLLQKQEVIPRWRLIVQPLFARLRDYYGLKSEDGGVLVDYVIPDGGPHKFGLRAKDILIEIDGHRIDNFGDIFFEPLRQKIYFREILNRKMVGDPLTVKVIRDQESLEIKGEVTPSLPVLVPKVFTPANYFIFGGLGFVELTYNCLQTLGKSGVSLKEKYWGEYPAKPNQKIVIISEVFPEYGLVKTSPYLRRVKKINGEQVLNLEHLYKQIHALKEASKKRALLELSRKLMLPLDITGAEALEQDIQQKYGILYMRTPGGFHY